MLRFNCLKCWSDLTAALERAGSLWVCPICDTPIVVPDAYSHQSLARRTVRRTFDLVIALLAFVAIVVLVVM